MKQLIIKLLYKYVYQDWNIAIADIADDFSPINIKWMKHSYTDRWFADPFIIGETDSSYIILVEEFLHSTQLGRLARLTVSKSNCQLIKNETILDLETHLSFPNPIIVNGKCYIYPENGTVGNTKYYQYGDRLQEMDVLLDLPLADATIISLEDKYYLFATIGQECNGNKLLIFSSNQPFTGYQQVQEIVFKDNIARRAGNVFQCCNKMISPAQVCNDNYGQAISLQELTINNGVLSLREFRRISPPTKEYSEGFHTYNVFKDKVVIDGYRYGSKFLHNLYYKIRK